MDEPIYAVYQTNYAEELRHKIDPQEEWAYSTAEKDAIYRIEHGPIIEDYYNVDNPIWEGILKIRLHEPSDTGLESLSPDTGSLLTGAIATIKWNCKQEDANPVTRASGLRALVYISQWLDRATKVPQMTPSNMNNPFFGFVGGPNACLDMAQDALTAILSSMPWGERQLLQRDIYHVKVGAALHELRSALKVGPEEKTTPQNYFLSQALNRWWTEGENRVMAWSLGRTGPKR